MNAPTLEVVSSTREHFRNCYSSDEVLQKYSQPFTRQSDFFTKARAAQLIIKASKEL